jgi:hypothetical protein
MTGSGVVRRSGYNANAACAILRLMSSYRRAFVPRRVLVVHGQPAGSAGDPACRPCREVARCGRSYSPKPCLYDRHVCRAARSSACDLETAAGRLRFFHALAADQESLRPQSRLNQLASIPIKYGRLGMVGSQDIHSFGCVKGPIATASVTSRIKPFRACHGRSEFRF